MKRLLLLYVILCTAEWAIGKTIYVENTLGWPDFYFYTWYSNGSYNSAFPGVKQTDFETIEGKDIYKIVLDDNCAGFKFAKANNDNQTKNLYLTDVEEGKYYYLKTGNNNDGYSGYHTMELVEMTLHQFDLTVISTEYQPHIYGWFVANGQKNEPFGDWPGKKMKQLEGTNGVYNYTFKSFKTDYFNLILNNGSNNTQTATLEVTSDIVYILEGTTVYEAETMTTPSSGISTYVSTSALNIEKSYPTLKAYKAEDENNGSALLTPITNPAANTPMLLVGTGSKKYYLPKVESGTSVSTNAFIAGTGDYVYQKTGDMYNYILHSGLFYAANGNKVAANKAYLQLSKNTEAKPVTLIYADEESVPTGIVSIASKAEDGEPCYNLQGMRVEMLRKGGLYIRGGKKFVVK